MSAILRQLAPKEDKHKTKTRMPLTHKPMLLHTRGMIHQHAQVFENLRDLIPHAKREQAMNAKDFVVLDQIAADRFCDTIGVFETRHKRVSSECYFWIATCPSGPSINFYVRDAQSIENLRLIGNSLKGSRPILQFDPRFNDGGVMEIAKWSLQRLFSVPFEDPHSKPFVDRTMSFIIEEGFIIMRHYQIQWGENGEETELAEIGPRVVLEPNYVLAGAFKGHKIWTNKEFVSPYKELKAERRKRAEMRNKAREKQAEREEKKMNLPTIEDPNAGLFVPQKTEEEDDE